MSNRTLLFLAVLFMGWLLSQQTSPTRKTYRAVKAADRAAGIDLGTELGEL